MKKTLVLLSFLCVLLAPHSAQAKLGFGLRGGVNVSHLSLSNDLFDSSNRTGFMFGPTMKFMLPGIGVDASALFSQENGEINHTTIHKNSLSLPVNLRLSTGIGSIAGVFVTAGPQFDFNVGKKNYAIGEQRLHLKDSNVSVNLGVGAYVSKIEVSVAYSIKCGRAGDLSAESVKQTMGDTLSGKLHSNMWKLSAAFYF